MTTKRIEPGTKIKLTAKFLRNTGQYTGPEGISRWVVQACACGLCATGDFVRTNQRSATFTPDGYADIAGTPDYEAVQWRHLNTANVQVSK